MDKLDYWKLCTDFTIVQAALLACGVAPEEMQWNVERMTEAQCPPGYIAIRTALRNALYSGRINSSKPSFTLNDDGEPTKYYDLESTTISTEEIDRFLKSSGVICDFFDRPGLEGEHGPGGPSPMPFKLSAALKAWSAVANDPVRLRGRSPKQGLEQWLVENAGDLGLLNRHGQPNRTGIEEICKVANWKPGGGATPTPTSMPSAPPPSSVRPLIRLPVRRLAEFTPDLDDEIPF